jgi:uncharacterized protein (TIGR03435 family)
MNQQTSSKCGFIRKMLLKLAGFAAMATPIVLGLVNVSQARAQAAVATPPQTVTAAPSQGFAGTWQCTVKLGRDQRMVVKIAKADSGEYKAVFYAIDQGGQSLNANTVTVDGSTVKITLNLVGGTFAGKISADGQTIAGEWSQGPNPTPLTLARATPETAWEIPVPPPPQPPMAENADPSFEVATIKPNISGAASMQGLTLRGRNFATRNSSLGDLIAFAYNVQMKQIIGGPDWMEKDRYDIAAVPEQEGVPNPDQLRTMIKKLLADRFKLTFHNDKKELSAFVLTVGKNGQMLTPTQLKGPLPGLGIRPGAGGITLNMANATIGDFTSFLQMLVLDRPVDQTGIKGRYDYQCTFLPDDSQFNGHPPPVQPATSGTESAPGLFDAIQQQLGLKLDAEKTPVDVIAIDHVEKPSAN